MGLCPDCHLEIWTPGSGTASSPGDALVCECPTLNHLYRDSLLGKELPTSEDE